MSNNVITLGGATLDTFLNYGGSDIMTIEKKDMYRQYMLFESGEKIEIDGVENTSGGGATNTAVSFQRLGFQTTCVARIGNDNAGACVRSELAREGVSVAALKQSTDQPTGSSYIINSVHGERTVFTHRGANTLLTTDDLSADLLANHQQLYITSLSKEAATILPAITQKAKKAGLRTAINPGSSQLSYTTITLKKSLQFIDVLIMNSAEARTFMMALIHTDEHYTQAFAASSTQSACGLNANSALPYLLEAYLPYDDHRFSMARFFKEALAMGPSIVVVTNGANGVYVATNNTVYFHPSVPTTVISSVGAGDAFGSCFVASLLDDCSIQDALRNGVINSASVLSQVGPKKGLLRKERLTSHRAHLDPHHLKTIPLQ
jgi:sugar/nucleoside kinase (ribokinase family)